MRRMPDAYALRARCAAYASSGGCKPFASGLRGRREGKKKKREKREREEREKGKKGKKKREGKMNAVRSTKVG